MISIVLACFATCLSSLKKTVFVEVIDCTKLTRIEVAICVKIEWRTLKFISFVDEVEKLGID